MLSRRNFLKNACSSTALSALALSTAPFSPALAKARTTLPIPQLDTGRMEKGVRVFDLHLQKGRHAFFSGRKAHTLGVNGDLLGPTLKFVNGENVRLNVKNSIGESTTLHWHGLHLPAKADGGPHQVIENGGVWRSEFQVKQKAAMFWYHPHLHRHTGTHTYHGIAGAILVEDEESKALDLPHEYGVNDIPLILQDRRFGANGMLQYISGMHDRMNGIKGNVLLVNGAPSPSFAASTGRIRLRLLNGSNARIYTLGFAGNQSFQIIGSDGGLLEKPVNARRLTLSPGERCQILVDLSSVPAGRSLQLKSFGYLSASGGGGMMGGGMMGGRGSGMMGGGMMQRMSDNGRKFDVLNIISSGQKATGPVPASLATLPELNPRKAAKTRSFSLETAMGPMVMMGMTKRPMTINGKAMNLKRIDERVKLGSTEIWEISNPSMMAHPFHIHDVQFRILDRNGHAPGGHETGPKDTVLLAPGETVRVVMKFEDYADPDHPYMYHCHILEHEDWGMMGQFVVEA